LDRALSGQDISIDDATRLFDADGSDLMALIAAADQLRAQTVGDVVTYVINRNINFTNVCVKACGFCAFSRGHLAEEGYFLPVQEILRRAQEARDLGATEVCVQAGLAPGLDGWHYVKLCRALKENLPDLHIHGFSPEEVLYGSSLTGASVKEYLTALKEAGVGSLPGTSAVLATKSRRSRWADRGRAWATFKPPRWPNSTIWRSREALPRRPRNTLRDIKSWRHYRFVPYLYTKARCFIANPYPACAMAPAAPR
jgi:FO synthase subunit 2